MKTSYTEAEAKTKLCRNHGMEKDLTCAGSACMQWEWDGGIEFERPSKTDAKIVSVTPVMKERKGHCGL
jgi:hypothetical protein